LTSVYEQLSKKYEVVVFWYNPNIYPKAEHDKRYDELIRYCKEMGIEVIQGNYDYDEEHQYYLDEVKGLEKEPEKGERCQKCYEMRLSATAWTAHELNSQYKHHIQESDRLLAPLEMTEGVRFDFFASELSVSPHKDAEALNKIGKKIEKDINACSCHPELDSEPVLNSIQESSEPLDSRLRGDDEKVYGNDGETAGDDKCKELKYLENDFKKAGGFKRSTELSKEHNLYRQNYCGCEFSLK
jgi:predicted adenine nucleotide alpha hydrolase (AANH) superfamily ATPase